MRRRVKRSIAALVACALHGVLLTVGPPASADGTRFTIYDGTISLWAREVGFLVNQLALTTDATPELTGRLQPPSERS